MHWIVLYPVDSVIHFSNNRGQRPEVAILGVDQKERGLWGRECESGKTPQGIDFRNRSKQIWSGHLDGLNTREETYFLLLFCQLVLCISGNNT